MAGASAAPGLEARAIACRDGVLPAMAALRAAADALENLVPAGRWPFPGYERLLFEI